MIPQLRVGPIIWLIAPALLIIPNAPRADTQYLEAWTNASFAGFYQEFPGGFDGTINGSFVYDATSGQVLHDTTILTVQETTVCGPGNCSTDALYPQSFPRLLITEPTSEPPNEFDTTFEIYFDSQFGAQRGLNKIIGGQMCFIAPNGEECDPFASVYGGLTAVPEISAWTMVLVGFCSLEIARYVLVRLRRVTALPPA